MTQQTLQHCLPQVDIRDTLFCPLLDNLLLGHQSLHNCNRVGFCAVLGHEWGWHGWLCDGRLSFNTGFSCISLLSPLPPAPCLRLTDSLLASFSAFSRHFLSSESTGNRWLSTYHNAELWYSQTWKCLPP